MKDFAIARAGRLYPAFIVCMTLTALVIAILGMPPHHTSLWQWVGNLVILAPWLGIEHMDGAYWSIVNEVVFYAWVAVFVGLGLFERHLLTIVAAWLALCVVNGQILHPIIEKMLGYDYIGTAFVTDYGPLFASGILIHRLWRGDRRPAVLVLLGLAIAIGATHAFTMVREFDTHFKAPIDVGALLVLHMLLYLIFAGGTVDLVAHHGNPAGAGARRHHVSAVSAAPDHRIHSVKSLGAGARTLGRVVSDRCSG